ATLDLHSFLHDALPIYDWIYIRFLASLGGKHEGCGERHVDLAEGRIRALYGARPQPRDHRELLAQEGLQIWAVFGHLRRNLNFRSEEHTSELQSLAYLV